jgi:hypothetical protein
LRGFYDDNINSVADKLDLSPFHRASTGFEVSPSVSLLLPMEATTLSAAYVYSYKYYDHQPAGNSDHDDQSHTFNLALDHAFNEHYQIAVKDSFVIGQEPDILRSGNAMTTFQRVPGDNIRNYGSINFDGKISRTFGYQIGYANSYFDYSADEPTTDFNGNVVPSISGLLDRLEHVIHLDGRWQIQPDTVGILGYQFRWIDYTGDEVLGETINSVGDLVSVKSDVRNSQSHYGYVGLDHTFRPDLTGSLRVGAQYTDYNNDPANESTVSPYVLASIRYLYMPESSVELGFTHDLNATDLMGFNGESFTRDQESSVVYLALSHRITPKLFGHLLGQFQSSEFRGGAYDKETERFYSAGVNLEYRFNHYLSSHVGYSYDKLESDLGDARNFDRNRVYIGVTATY